MIAHLNRPHDLRSWSDVDVAADHGRPLAPTSIRLADRDALANIAIVPDHGAFVYDDVSDVSDIQPTAD